jgi:excisionase family DNA binding protein
MEKDILNRISEVLDLQSQLLQELARLLSMLSLSDTSRGRSLERYLSIREVAQVLNLSEPVIRRAIVSGKIPAVKIGKKYLIPISVLDRLTLDKLNK